MSGLIYPVAVKPPSAINSWGSWPADVRETLVRWNKDAGRLTFVRSRFVFKCADCSEFCRAHTSGAAVCEGLWLCDDCLIERARTNNRKETR